MDPYPNDLRIPCPLGYRIDTTKVGSRMKALVDIAARSALLSDREATRQTETAVAQIRYLARLQRHAISRNGHSVDPAGQPMVSRFDPALGTTSLSRQQV